MKRKYKKRILKIFLIIVSTIVFVISAFLISINYSPQFGGTLTKSQIGKYNNSSNFKDGKFINKDGLDVSVKITFSGFIQNLPRLFEEADPTTIPQGDLPIEKIELSKLLKFKNETSLIWFGHSTFLLQMEGKNILIDPVFSDRASPFSWFGPKRFSSTLPISVNNIPKIDAVLISHDHYDHLDYNSIIEIKDKVKMFYTPLGVGVHLLKWGIEKERIIELDWWGESTLDDIDFIAAPAQHTSGRKFYARETSLWASWIIKSKTQNLYFSGDGGYGTHFKEIGERFGPFDFGMMECGQYNEMWSQMHLFPEETAQAGLDIKAKQIMPIHWGAFSISSHPWSEPVERVITAANKLNLPVIVPKIGESITIPNTNNSTDTWWENY